MSKKRVGFVSNSSSSSFICEVCGSNQSGWDISLDEAEMVECVNGHVICKDHISSYPESDNDEDDYDEYEFPESHCPVCQFEEYSEEELTKYVFKKYNVDKEKTFQEIKERFKTWEEFNNYLTEKK